MSNQSERRAAEPPTAHNRISEAQLAANQANAQLSTGPITPEGRAISAMNALKTGLTGKTVFLPSEDKNRYQQEFNGYVERYQPANDEELALVQSILDCNWRLDRAQRLESGVLLKGHIECAAKYADRPEHERATLIETEAYIKYEKQIRNLNIQEARLRRTLEKVKKELAILQATRHQKEKAAAPQHLENGFEFSTNPTKHHAAPTTTALAGQTPLSETRL